MNYFIPGALSNNHSCLHKPSGSLKTRIYFSRISVKTGRLRIISPIVVLSERYWQDFLIIHRKRYTMVDGHILYVGGDEDDRYLVTDALKEIGCTNQVINFEDGPALIEYLQVAHERPFIILCDLHLPQISGLELKEIINADEKLKKRSIPFIFLSDAVHPKDVEAAYMSLVQGFYLKSQTYEGLKDQLRAICEYWKQAVLPKEGV